MRLIDADSLKEEVGKLWEELDDVDFGELVRDFWKILNKFPTIDAEPVRHGRWDKEKIAFFWRCENCYAAVASNLDNVFLDIAGKDLNYCPNCGAKMDEEER